MNKVTKNYLEKELARSIERLEFFKIKAALKELGRALTDEEKDLIITLSKTQDVKQEVEAIKLTGCTKKTTKDLVVRFATQSRHIVQDLSELNPKKIWVKEVIQHFIKLGEIGVAKEYAETIKYELSREDLLGCLQAMIKDDGGENSNSIYSSSFLKVAKLLGYRKVPKKYRLQLQERARKEHSYEGFKQWSDKDAVLDEEWFNACMKDYIDKKYYDDALSAVCTERAFSIPILPLLFEKVVSNHSHSTGRRIKEFIAIAPQETVSALGIVLLKKGWPLRHLVEELNYPINDAMRKTYADCIDSIRPGSEAWRNGFDIDDVLKHFGRKPTAYEMEKFLSYIARSGDFGYVFKLAKEYRFKVTEHVLFLLDEANR